MRHLLVDSYVHRTYVRGWPASASDGTPPKHALLIDDPDHSATEDRFVLLGLSVRFRVLLVVHSYRESEEVIRIISARRATKPERDRYDERWRE